MNRNWAITKHFSPLFIKSKGRLNSKYKKKKISNLHFPSSIHHLFSLRTFKDSLIFHWGKNNLGNSHTLKAQKSTMGAQQRQLTKPIAPKDMQRMFCPWLFMSTRARYYLFIFGVFVTRSRPITEVMNASSRVQGRLKGHITMNMTLNMVSTVKRTSDSFISPVFDL